MEDNILNLNKFPSFPISVQDAKINTTLKITKIKKVTSTVNIDT